MNGIENNVHGGVCGKDTARSSQGRRVNPLWWFRNEQHTRSAASNRDYSFWCTRPTDKSDARFAREIPRKISAAETQAVAKGGSLAELSRSLAISIDTVSAQQKEIKPLYGHINTMKNKGNQASRIGTTEGGAMTRNVFPHCAVVGRTAPHKNNSCYFNPLLRVTMAGTG